jgi:hypothetical protein
MTPTQQLGEGFARVRFDGSQSGVRGECCLRSVAQSVDDGNEGRFSDVGYQVGVARFHFAGARASRRAPVDQ